MRRATYRIVRVTSTNAKFQSTLSVRRATYRPGGLATIFQRFQSTLSVRRATVLDIIYEDSSIISIHALREESDTEIHQIKCTQLGFQSTLSVRRATLYMYYGDCQLYWISIHALREESDRLQVHIDSTDKNFNPRSPWGERRCKGVLLSTYNVNFNPRSPWGERQAIEWILIMADLEFQSTLSVRRATRKYWVSIPYCWFQSTLSVRRATIFSTVLFLFLPISIHALREESDGIQNGNLSKSPELISIHALREESDIY